MNARNVFRNIITLLLAVVFLLPSETLANALVEREAVGQYQPDEDVIRLERYIYIIEDDYLQFDVEQAMEDNLEEHLIESGKMFNKLVNAEYAYNKSEVQPQSQFAYWGNWCGPGYGGGTPIDILDHGCMNHDICYGNHGYHRCLCDYDLLNYIRNNKSRMTAGQKAAATGMELWLGIKVSNPGLTGGNLSCKW